MKTNTAVLNAKNKTITFNFADQDFTVNLMKGDLHDIWNNITTCNGIMYDVNFDWDLKPNLTLYRCGDNEQQYDDTTSINVVSVIGTKADYFDLSFDSSLDCVFILFSAEKVKKLTTTSLNMLSDSKEKTDYIITVDSNGATKTIY